VLYNPEFAVRVVYDADRLAKGDGNFVILTLKVDRLVVIDPARTAQGEVQIKQA
jgi:hypothetical protein